MNTFVIDMKLHRPTEKCFQK